MRRSLLHKLSMVCSLTLSMAIAKAQPSFEYKSSLNEVKTAGFYKIVLLPAIVAKTKNELNDIRILDEKGAQVPYILRSDKTTFEEKNFIEFPILDMKREADKQTHVVIENKSGKAIDKLLLFIKNTEAERTVTLSGSDDQKQWYVIKERIPLSNVTVSGKDRFVQSLNFPKSSYKFFEIIINGKDVLPVNIVKVGVYEGVLLNGSFSNIPQPTITQKDSSDNRSYISLVFNESYLINKLQLTFQGPKFFRRQISLRNTEGYVAYNDLASSDTEPVYNINVKSKKMLLVIENQDNPPIKLQSVKTYQLNKYLLSYLEPAKKYQLVFGDSIMNTPRYDLDFFKDSLNRNFEEVSTGAITKLDSLKVNPESKGIKSMLPLWIIIIVVLILLLVLTVRMTKEVAKKNMEQKD